MYLTDNKGKSVVADRFIENLNAKSIKKGQLMIKIWS